MSSRPCWHERMEPQGCERHRWASRKAERAGTRVSQSLRSCPVYPPRRASVRQRRLVKICCLTPNSPKEQSNGGSLDLGHSQVSQIIKTLNRRMRASEWNDWRIQCLLFTPGVFAVNAPRSLRTTRPWRLGLRSHSQIRTTRQPLLRNSFVTR
jgi:hypothetical protein